MRKSMLRFGARPLRIAMLLGIHLVNKQVNDILADRANPAEQYYQTSGHGAR